MEEFYLGCTLLKVAARQQVILFCYMLHATLLPTTCYSATYYLLFCYLPPRHLNHHEQFSVVFRTIYNNRHYNAQLEES